MKKIRNIIICLFCGLGLFAATMSTTITAAEPLSTKIYSCINVCGFEVCILGLYDSGDLAIIEGVVNWHLGC
ncbi:MAG: hypothetical protein LBP85_04305 [Prevotellaceae bacterium]|jgi:hypothetical protein|nr:hypothetical protein [Prevotellaceae bacterium]